MGGGTFFKVGATSARQKIYRKFLWIELATVTSQALKYDVITYTLYQGFSKLSLAMYPFIILIDEHVPLNIDAGRIFFREGPIVEFPGVDQK